MLQSLRRIARAFAPLDAWRGEGGAIGSRRRAWPPWGGLAVLDTFGGNGRQDAIGRLVREGRRVRLRTHVPANRPAFQRWYADQEIVQLLRHDQTTLTSEQSRSYFDTIILPLSAKGLCFAIHEVETDDLIGTTALTDLSQRARSALFRIVIGEKDRWGRGYGTEATELVALEAFTALGLSQIRLEVFRHNDRALATYRRVGFRELGEHVEWIGPQRFELRVVEMALDREEFFRHRLGGDETVGSQPVPEP